MLAAIPDRLAVDVTDAQALKAKAASGDHAALVGAAKQFESMMVAQMLKSMRETRFSDDDDPMNGGDSMKLYRDLLDQQWAAQLSKGQGLGFATMMVKAMERLPHAASESPSTSPQENAKTAAGLVERTVPAAATAQQEGGDIPVVGGLNPAAAAAQAKSASTKMDFITRMRPYADAAAKATGVPAEFILGHAALESGWGRHEILDAEGRGSHNLFGIKAGRTWDGAVAETLTTEYRQGVPMKLTQQFRAYADYTSAFTDYANLLKNRYGAALEGGADSVAFAKGLVAGGYATDPAYADKLQSVIARVAMTDV